MIRERENGREKKKIQFKSNRKIFFDKPEGNIGKHTLVECLVNVFFSIKN